MNITKEQMLEHWKESGCGCGADYMYECDICREIKNLIESSGDRASVTDEKVIFKEGDEVWSPGTGPAVVVKSAPSPAPTIKQDLTVGPKEAMRWLVDMEKYWSVNDHDGVCIVVIKAALRPKVVSREWVEELAEVARWGDKDGGYARVKSRLCSELGIVVGEKP